MFPASEELIGCHEGVEIIKDIRTKEITVRLQERNVTLAKRSREGVWSAISRRGVGLEWVPVSKMIENAQHDQATEKPLPKRIAMNIHLRIENDNVTHTRFSVFVNGALAGTLCLRNEEFDDFANIFSGALGDSCKVTGKE